MRQRRIHLVNKRSPVCDVCQEFGEVTRTEYKWGWESPSAPRSIIEICDSCLKSADAYDVTFYNDDKGEELLDGI
jgi:hypothetical protein